MGFIGQANAPEVNKAAIDAISKIVAAGKAAGILTLNTELLQQCRNIGATFIATDIDVSLFARHMRRSAASAKKHLS